MDAVEQISPPLRLGERLVVRHRLPDRLATDAFINAAAFPALEPYCISKS